jgi:hypothetical protein
MSGKLNHHYFQHYMPKPGVRLSVHSWFPFMSLRLSMEKRMISVFRDKCCRSRLSVTYEDITLSVCITVNKVSGN